MAHVGQEFTLCPVGGFGHLFRALKRSFCQFPLRNIDADRSDQLFPIRSLERKFKIQPIMEDSIGGRDGFLKLQHAFCGNDLMVSKEKPLSNFLGNPVG